MLGHEEVIQTDQDVQVSIDVPGVKMSDLQVSVEDTDGTVRISGTRTVSYMDGKAVKKSKIEKMFSLYPETTDLSKIEANLSDGVLTIRVPKKVKPQPRTIKIMEQKVLKADGAGDKDAKPTKVEVKALNELQAKVKEDAKSEAKKNVDKKPESDKADTEH
ncbi:hypothetical protein ACA910_021363 [Epithemia clementina (nom. ined.)]